MAYENNDKKMESVYSKRIRAGKRRTYFFDVRATRGNDYYLTITESRKRFNDDGYDRHKIFLYKEDFNKFCKALNEAVDYVKTDLMPDFDFDAFNHEYPEGEDNHNNGSNGYHHHQPAAELEDAKPQGIAQAIEEEAEVTTVAPVTSTITSSVDHTTEEVDKW